MALFLILESWGNKTSHLNYNKKKEDRAMKNSFELHKLTDNFAGTKAGRDIAAMVEGRVVGARDSEIILAASVSSPSPQLGGRAA
jgi:hypothetical protein